MRRSFGIAWDGLVPAGGGTGRARGPARTRSAQPSKTSSDATVIARVAENGIHFDTLTDPEGAKFGVIDE